MTAIGAASRTKSSQPTQLKIVADIAQQSDEARVSIDRLALVAEAATEGLYDWDIRHNQLYVSPRLNRMFGFEGGRFVSETWFTRVHRDDKETYRQALVDLFRQKQERLQGHADPGGILIGHETFALIKHEIAAEPQSSLQLKGVSKRVRAYKVPVPDGPVPAAQERITQRLQAELKRLDKASARRALETLRRQIERDDQQGETSTC